MPSKTYRIFITHAWTYASEYYRLVNLLDAAPYFSWTNYSVPKHDALEEPKSKLVEALRDQIRPVNIVIVLAGMYVIYREWIQKEIDIAQAMKKPILGVRPRGHVRTPKEVQEASVEMVGWSTESIVKAIRDYSL